MPSRTTTTPGRFLGVRLTDDEDRRLAEFERARGLSSRSEAIRLLLSDAKTERSAPALELPATRQHELETLVEEGYFSTVQSALEHLLESGLAELLRHRAEGLSNLRRHARELRGERQGRRRADREGRELLRR